MTSQKSFYEDALDEELVILASLKEGLMADVLKSSYLPSLLKESERKGNTSVCSYIITELSQGSIGAFADARGDFAEAVTRVSREEYFAKKRQNVVCDLQTIDVLSRSASDLLGVFSAVNKIYRSVDYGHSVTSETLLRQRRKVQDAHGEVTDALGVVGRLGR